MREILFRGKRIDNGEWVEGYYAMQSNHACFEDELKYTHFIFKDIFLDFNLGGLQKFEVIPETVGQYTGLTDKNSTKIFEGDVVNFKTTAYYFKNCRIKYQSYYGGYCAIDNHGYEYLMDKIFEYEVIGNIHDNKLEDFQNNPEPLNN